MTVDPTPCYPHDVELVRAEARRVACCFPIGFATNVTVSLWEEPNRTNGWASTVDEWGGDEKPRPWEGMIFLAGKRIPPHPAMTRYLVAHEYGHIVNYWLSHVLHASEHMSALYDEYAELRGHHDRPTNYGPGQWHLGVGELIANDFRILVARSELEFWPHPGIERPEQLPKVREFWRQMLRHAALGPSCA